MHNWTVPAGVHLAHFDVRGAQGGGNDLFGLPLFQGGEGGRTVAEVRVIPGEVIHIFVGGKGGDGGSCPHRNPPAEQSRGGFNGGGNGGTCNHGGVGAGGGGGASDIRVEGTHLTNRIMVAGGGGGSSDKLYAPCGNSIGGAGGGLEGAHGVAAVDGCIGGRGGTRTSGGAGADQGHGSLGFGGHGQTALVYKSASGGGGGGGYYGGGGGWLGAGGGGGSGFGPRVDFPPVKFYTGTNKGNGRVVITWEQPD